MGAGAVALASDEEAARSDACPDSQWQPSVNAPAHAVSVRCPAGSCKFSVVHPVLSAPAGRWVQDASGVRRERVVGDYFSEGPLTEPWIFGAAPAEVRDRYQPFTVAYAHGP
jgi:hypothetical protein